MAVRRFIFDESLGAVVELGLVREGADPARQYDDARQEYKERSGREANDRLGAQYRAASLDRADRREWAHKRFGDERRWAR